MLFSAFATEGYILWLRKLNYSFLPLLTRLNLMVNIQPQSPLLICSPLSHQKSLFLPSWSTAHLLMRLITVDFVWVFCLSSYIWSLWSSSPPPSTIPLPRTEKPLSPIVNLLMWLKPKIGFLHQNIRIYISTIFSVLSVALSARPTFPPFQLMCCYRLPRK